MNPSTSFEITLYLVNLKTPQITIINETMIVGISRNGEFIKVCEYKKTAGATPNETMSDRESIFLPNSYTSILLVFRATHPSTESKSNDRIIKIAAM